ncbi:MAG: hypothetical protein ACTIDE_10035 [Carnobacterium maltaromaticum]
MKKHEALVDLVVGMLSSYFDSENVYKPRLVTNQIIKGKAMENHVDIYLEFTQMNNTERTVINVVSGREVNTQDVLKLANTLDDLEFKSKGVLYYDLCISEEAIAVAEYKLKTSKFVFQEEVIKSMIKRFGMMLPDETVIGDPFWVIMETDADVGNKGNYYICGDMIPLFLSYKQAKEIADGNHGYEVCGLSQNHLRTLSGITSATSHELGLLIPRYGSLKSDEYEPLIYAPGNKNILKSYFRGENYV